MVRTGSTFAWIVALWLGVAVGCAPAEPEPGRADAVAVGQGSYTTALPEGAQGPVGEGGTAVTPLTTAGFSLPVPTNDWWTSLAWNNSGNPYSGQLFAHPLAFQARADGLDVWYPTEVHVDDRSYFFDVTTDLRVGVAGLDAPDARLAAYSDWTVTAAWDDGANGLRATFGHGLPFAYFTKTGGAAAVTFNGAPEVWHHGDGVVGATVNGHHYGIFGPSSAAWTGDATLHSDLDGHDFFSIALLPDPDPATLEAFRRHAYAFVSDTRVDWAYDEATARLTTTFSATTTLKQQGDGRVNQTLMALYRHQWRHTGAGLTGYTYTSPRGMMKVLDGNRFQTTLPFGGVLPALPAGCKADGDSTLHAYVDRVFEEEELFSDNLGKGDTYWSGKGMSRLAELVPLADAVGHPAARDRFLDAIKATLEDWFTATDDTTLFYYDDVWRTLIGFPADFGSNTDLNDHHFHYGYHVLAAATVARYDPDWAAPERWGGMVELLIKDAANGDRGDERFPFLRHFDPYAGHSWASGHGGYADRGNNQESSSEAMNFAGALIRWGLETGDPALRDLGIYLYATERSAIEQYWFDAEDAVFPEGFDHTTVAIVWGNGGVYGTWFGDDPEFIHGINYLPFTGGSFYLGRDPDYVRANYAEVLRNHGGAPDTWPDLMLEYLALADAEGAFGRFEDLVAAGYTPEDGETIAHTYRWIHGLTTLGRVDTTVTADAPAYAVFKRDGARRYVAYNPGDEASAVSFSDGFSMEVPAGVMRTQCPE